VTDALHTANCLECPPGIVHLAAWEGRTACGAKTKRGSLSTASVTCQGCRATWAFATISLRDRIINRIKGGTRCD